MNQPTPSESLTPTSPAEAPTLMPQDVSAANTTPTLPAAPSSPMQDIAAQLREHPRYRVIRLLGQGGMGAVYLAEHLFMSRQVALKVVSTALMDSDDALERFHQEVKAAAQLSHPNIVAAHDADQVGGLHFLVMEYIEGVNLAEYLARVGPLSIPEACAVIEQAAHGLQHAHEKGMVHRDIKPQNLMRTRDGVVKILDFGLARLVRERGQPKQDGITGTGVVMGTADYIAPEQTRGSRGVDIRADIYGLGCTLYHLLTGQVPFPNGTVVDKMVRHCMDAPQPLRSLRPEVPPELEAVIGKMMAKEPGKRYQTPAAVAAALHLFVAARPQPLEPILIGAAVAEVANEPKAAHELSTVHAVPRKTDLEEAVTESAGGKRQRPLLSVGILLLIGAAVGTVFLALPTWSETIFLICAIIGGTLLVCQFFLALLGVGHHGLGDHDLHTEVAHDLGHDAHGHESDHADNTGWFTGLLTFRSIVAAMTFFGLAGMAARSGGLEDRPSLLIALIAGTTALVVVAVAMRLLARLRDDGTARIDHAVGATGTVYLSIPGHKSGTGKVHLKLQNRIVEYGAVTAADELPTGSLVVVVSVPGPGTVEVASAPSPEKTKPVA